MQIDDAPERLRAVFDRLPPEREVIVAGSANDWRLIEIHGLASYLAWPRAVWLAPFGEKGNFAIEAPSPPMAARVGVILLFNTALPPDAAEKVIALGPRLHAVMQP